MPTEAKKVEEPDNQEELQIEVEEEKEQETTEAPVAEESSEPEKTKAPEENSEKELEEYSEGVQKRISKLTAKMREAERREKAALEYAQSVQKQLEESSQRTTTLDNSFVTEFESRLGFQEQALRTKLKDAIDRGDIDGQVEAQQELAKLAQDNERLAYVKQQREVQAKQAEAQPQQPQPQKPVQADPKAAAWAEKNEWFGADEPMTLTAFSIHKTLIESEGYDPASDDYYQELDRRMRTEFPHKFGEQPPVKNGRSGPAVASANRGGQRGNQKTIKLTQSQVAIARKLGITNEQYAKQLLRMQNS